MDSSTATTCPARTRSPSRTCSAATVPGMAARRTPSEAPRPSPAEAAEAASATATRPSMAAMAEEETVLVAHRLRPAANAVDCDAPSGSVGIGLGMNPPRRTVALDLK